MSNPKIILLYLIDKYQLRLYYIGNFNLIGGFILKSFFKSKIILFSIIFLMLFSTLCFASDVVTTSLETSNEAVTTDISENEITATDTVRTDPTYELIA